MGWRAHALLRRANLRIGAAAAEPRASDRRPTRPVIQPQICARAAHDRMLSLAIDLADVRVRGSARKKT